MIGLASLTQQRLGQDPFNGQLFVFRGKRGDFLDPAVAGYRVVEPGAFAQQLLRRSGVVPQARVLDLVV